MYNLPIDTLFFPLIEELCGMDPALKIAYCKVAGKLKDYSRSRGIEPNDLRLLDVCDGTEDINPKLYKYIDHLPRGKKQTEQNYRDGKEQIRSIVRRLISASLGTLLPRGEDRDKSYIIAGTPEVLKPILPLLPRRSGSFVCKKPGWREAREQAPLSEGAQSILLTLIEVVNRFHVDTLESLLVGHSDHVREALYKRARPQELDSLSGHYSRLLLKVKQEYDFPFAKGRQKSVYFNELPPTLKSEVQNFVDKAPHGLESYSEFLDRDEDYEGSTEPFEKITINNYVEAILRGIKDILRDFSIDDLSVRDLMTLEEIEREYAKGTKKVPGNRYIEAYFKRERGKTSDRKRKGFDSTCFDTFINAIKAVAAFNGIFDLQEEFRAAYRARLDKSTRNRAKANLKLELSLAALDKAITEMRPRFLAIMKERSYTFEDIVSPAVRERINFCFFYVDLVTMRYFAYRQRQIRDCIDGKNIVFKTDGSVTFHWEANKVKNDRILNHPLDINYHGEAYAIPLEALNLYHRRLYRFAVKRDADTIKKQFFLRLNKQGRFQGYADDNSSGSASAFRNWFTRCVRKYLKNLEKLYPHFVRGLCADWYAIVLKIGKEKTSDILGDLIGTVEKDYLDRNAPYDGTAAFNAAAEVIRDRERKENGAKTPAEVALIVRLYEERDRIKDEQLKEAKAEVERLRKEVEEYRSDWRKAG